MRIAASSLVALYMAVASASLIDYVSWQQWLGVFGDASTISPSVSDTAYEQLAHMADSSRKTLLAHLDDLSTEANVYPARKCTKESIKIRKEYGALTDKERIAFTDAVVCLQNIPARTPSSVAAGAKSRYDDFVAHHIVVTPFVHSSGLFLPFHRYFTWVFEQALINECGFTGALPYWDWAKTARDGLENSPIFDGTATSMSGNGVRTEFEGTILLHNCAAAPIGTGGGCVKSGPFKNMVVNMGPVLLSIPGNRTVGSKTPLGWNPRCLSRSFTQQINDRYSNATGILNTISQTSIADFQVVLSGQNGNPEVGIHSGGHYTIGGDPARDYNVSPGDPIFYPHHSMVDRVWWMWQMMDTENRTLGDNAIYGTLTEENIPTSANVTFDTVIDLGYVGAPILPFRDLMSTIDGPFCYMYE